MAQSIRSGGAKPPKRVAAQGSTKSAHHCLIILDFFERLNRVGTIGEVSGVFQLIEPFLLFFVKFGSLENVVPFVEEHHERGGVRWNGEDLLGLRNGNGIKLGAGCGLDFDVNRDAKDAHAAFDFLRLLDGQSNLMLVVVVGITQIEFRRARPIKPLGKKLIHVNV